MGIVKLHSWRIWVFVKKTKNKKQLAIIFLLILNPPSIYKNIHCKLGYLLSYSMSRAPAAMWIVLVVPYALRIRHGIRWYKRFLWTLWFLWLLNEIYPLFNKHLLPISKLSEDCHYDIFCLHSTVENTFTRSFNTFQNWCLKNGPK